MYVSGQGASDAKGQRPPTIDAQIRQTLENVRVILEAEKITFQHVVSAHVYLADMKDYEALNRIWAEYFPKDPPTRTVLGVVRMPTDSPVEITVVAAVNLRAKQVLKQPGTKPSESVSAGISTGDRIYLSAATGRDRAGVIPTDARAQVRIVVAELEAVLKQSGLQIRNMVYANIYVDPGMPLKELAAVIDDFIPDETARTVIQTNSLPFGTHIQISGLASGDSKRLGGHCTTVAETVYCSGRVGTVRQALDSLKADLQAGGLNLSRSVSANVYIDELDQFTSMNKVYSTYFGDVPPTRTTVQPWKGVPELSLPPTTGVATAQDDSPRAQVSIIAVR